MVLAVCARRVAEVFCSEVTQYMVPSFTGSSDITTVEERHEDDSEGMSLSNLVCAAASKTRDPSRLSVTLDGSTISRLSSADLQRHRSLEEELAKKYNGVQRVPLNFEPCMLHLDATTTNTRRPYCIVNGENCVLQMCVCVCVRAHSVLVLCVMADICCYGDVPRARVCGGQCEKQTPDPTPTLKCNTDLEVGTRSAWDSKCHNYVNAGTMVSAAVL